MEDRITISLKPSTIDDLLQALSADSVANPQDDLPPINPDGSITPSWLEALNAKVIEKHPSGYYPTSPDGSRPAWAQPIGLVGSIIWSGTLARPDITQEQRDSIERILTESYGLAMQALTYRPIRLYPWGDGTPHGPFARQRYVAPTSYAPDVKDPIPTMHDLRRVAERSYDYLEVF